jgi:hypothetical protein
MYQVGLEGDPLFEWVRTATRPDDVFLTDWFVVHGILEAGRRIYLGWPYFAWSAGYDVRSREDTIQAIFASTTGPELVSRLQDAGIDYVAIDDGLRDREMVDARGEGLIRSTLDPAFADPDNRYGHIAIYRVPNTPP